MVKVPEHRSFTVKIDPLYVLGVDPGQKGGMALLELGYKTTVGDVFEFEKKTDHEIADWLRARHTYIKAAVLEMVRSRPGQGVSAVFTFGRGYGFVGGLLTAFQIPFQEVIPQVWQKHFNIPPKKDKSPADHKKVLQARAHRRWPKSSGKITLGVADAVLLAEWLRVQGE